MRREKEVEEDESNSEAEQTNLSPPIWERVSCYISLQRWSICPSAPSHRHVSPSSPLSESSHPQSSWLILSLLPITLLAPQTVGAHANKSQGPHLHSSHFGLPNPIQHCLCLIKIHIWYIYSWNTSASANLEGFCVSTGHSMLQTKVLIGLLASENPFPIGTRPLTRHHS